MGMFYNNYFQRTVQQVRCDNGCQSVFACLCVKYNRLIFTLRQIEYNDEAEQKQNKKDFHPARYNGRKRPVLDKKYLFNFLMISLPGISDLCL